MYYSYLWGKCAAVTRAMLTLFCFGQVINGPTSLRAEKPDMLKLVLMVVIGSTRFDAKSWQIRPKLKISEKAKIKQPKSGRKRTKVK